MNAGRSLSCTKCGAHAPELAPAQRSFVCSYCRTQTFVEPAAGEADANDPRRDEQLMMDFRRHYRWHSLLAVAMVPIVVFVFFMFFSRGPASELSGCRTFDGDMHEATWGGCPSKSSFQIVCKPTFDLPGLPARALPAGFDSLHCDCLRDGASKWFFNAKTAPPLKSREDAERVASMNCEMW